ncbi:hypothetical protein B0H03_12223 [Rathayibacter iranicus NCPPB 2253 = VKM Ac-1602]|uniref:Uncharacterized protein n=1 Tax=Rathayibacter iranicus NCPPB 2253 = VKM Ac-1602 TaxID=1328868 RepID=A0ABX5LCR3_9MICO|nr:hypothetical protein B0H03_12223 [Rathayibacter iranicus NCPPB 2253 = VKM Ac-1602]
MLSVTDTHESISINRILHKPQYLPKCTDLSNWYAEDLEAIALARNDRPQKVLPWKTPAQVFAEQLHSLPESSVESTG